MAEAHPQPEQSAPDSGESIGASSNAAEEKQPPQRRVLRPSTQQLIFETEAKNQAAAGPTEEEKSAYERSIRSFSPKHDSLRCRVDFERFLTFNGYTTMAERYMNRSDEGHRKCSDAIDAIRMKLFNEAREKRQLRLQQLKKLQSQVTVVVHKQAMKQDEYLECLKKEYNAVIESSDQLPTKEDLATRENFKNFLKETKSWDLYNIYSNSLDEDNLPYLNLIEIIRQERLNAEVERLQKQELERKAQLAVQPEPAEKEDKKESLAVSTADNKDSKEPRGPEAKDDTRRDLPPNVTEEEQYSQETPEQLEEMGKKRQQEQKEQQLNTLLKVFAYFLIPQKDQKEEEKLATAATLAQLKTFATPEQRLFQEEYRAISDCKLTPEDRAFSISRIAKNVASIYVPSRRVNFNETPNTSELHFDTELIYGFMDRMQKRLDLIRELAEQKPNLIEELSKQYSFTINHIRNILFTYWSMARSKYENLTKLNRYIAAVQIIKENRQPETLGNHIQELYAINAAVSQMGAEGYLAKEELLKVKALVEETEHLIKEYQAISEVARKQTDITNAMMTVQTRAEPPIKPRIFAFNYPANFPAETTQYSSWSKGMAFVTIIGILALIAASIFFPPLGLAIAASLTSTILSIVGTALTTIGMLAFRFSETLRKDWQTFCSNHPWAAGVLAFIGIMLGGLSIVNCVSSLPAVFQAAKSLTVSLETANTLIITTGAITLIAGGATGVYDAATAKSPAPPHPAIAANDQFDAVVAAFSQPIHSPTRPLLDPSIQRPILVEGNSHRFN